MSSVRAKPERPHHVLVWVLIVLATLIAFVSALTTWVKREALDSNNVANSSARLLQDPRVRSALSTYLVDQIYQNVNVQQELEQNLPKQAKGLAGPISAALRQYGQRLTYELLGRPRVIAAFRRAVYTAHQNFLTIVEHKPGRGAQLYLRLRPVLIQVATRFGLEQQAIARLPPNAGQLQLASAKKLSTVRKAINTIRALSVFLAILVVILYGVAIYLARGWRREALVRAGFALLAAAIILFVVRKVAGNALINSLTQPGPNRQASNAAYAVLTDLLGTIAWTGVVMALLAILFGWLASPNRLARELRRFLAPALIRHPAIAWTVVGGVILLLFAFVPVTDWTNFISRLVIIALLVGGTEMVRRVARDEHPDGGWSLDEVHLPGARPPVESAGAPLAATAAESKETPPPAAPE
jgi:hypothetical protein